MYDFLLVINSNCGRIFYCLEIMTFTAIENGYSFPPFPRVTTPLGRYPLDFLGETYNASSRGMGLSYSENFIIQTPTVFD